jgi:hypothetical protein
MKREVIGCMGGGGNHLRCLLLLDPEFSYFRDHAPDNYTFMKECVYPDDRNWQNWLNYEWRWRLGLDVSIKFSHLNRIENDTKYCALRTDPDLAFKHYVKFNTNLNTTLIHTFKEKIVEYNDKLDKSLKDNILVVNSIDLFKPTLDQTLYYTATEWFGLSNCYEQAAQIHQRWWTLVKRAEQEIILDLQKIYT